MATSYPGSLDSFTNPTSTDAMDASAALYHDVQHANANDAIEAVQAELGTDPAGAYPTVKARLSTLPSSVYVSPSGFYPGCDYWTIDPAVAGSQALLTSQRLYFSRWACPASFTAAKLWWVQINPASTVTGAYVGIYDSSGNLLQSADIASVITSTGLKSATITSQSVSAGSVYFLAFLSNASSAGGIASSASFGTSLTGLMGSSSSDRPCYILNTQTSLPSSVTYSTASAQGQVLMIGVSA